MQMPWRTEIIEGLLGADLVGFQLPGGAQNFLVPGPAPHRRQHLPRPVGVRSRFGEVHVGFRTVKVGAFPISIDSAETRPDGPQPRHPAGGPARSAPSSAIRDKIMLGVDRLDYTKGIDVRLQGVRGAARRGPRSRPEER